MNFNLVPIAQLTVTPGTRQRVVAATGVRTLFRSVVLQWDPGNSGQIYLGDSTVTSTKCIKLDTASRTFIYEPPGGIKADQYVDLSLLYFDGSATDKLNVAYLDTTG